MRDVRSRSLIRSTRVAAAVIAVVVVVADQLTKAWALNTLSDGPNWLIGESVGLRLTRTSGAAFGLLEGAGSWLALIAIIVVAVVFMTLRHEMDRLGVFALGLVLGGALGNLGDRLFRGDGIADGLVVDFIDIGPWPNFNIADSAIVVGIILLLWASSESRQT